MTGSPEWYEPSGDEIIADRFDDIFDDPEHSHFSDKELEEFITLLWEAHDGDNSCDCLRHIICALVAHADRQALRFLRNCCAEHDAGLFSRVLEVESLEAALMPGKDQR